MKYDPHKNPAPRKWLSLTEYERLDLVQAYHSVKRITVPSATLHATIHTIVENQVALGDQIPVKATLVRLMLQGLDRHDAVHAIGSVLATQMFDLLQPGEIQHDASDQYFQGLSKLSAASWANSIDA
jgi:hypothetical protein